MKKKQYLCELFCANVRVYMRSARPSNDIMVSEKTIISE